MSRGGFEALDPCVHCGFCLPACPTYLATGDENDSPRGRIVLMRALERGEIPPGDADLRRHLDACLGCRGCEPVCPAGVGYGRGLEAARERLARANGLGLKARMVLRVFREESWWRPLLTVAGWVRESGVAAWLPAFSRRMLSASAAARSPLPAPRSLLPAPPSPRPAPRGTVALFRGCVMDTLFSAVHDATRRTLAANGYTVLEVEGQACCGALHDHAGDRSTARELLAVNARAFLDRADHVVVNSAGCGALLKDAPHLEDTPATRQLAARVRDVTELLAAAGPRPGAGLPLDVAYDAPCHLEHAQGIKQPPLAVLQAIPGLTVRRLPGSDRCCGSAGIFSLLRPAMARAVLADKIAAIAAAEPRPAFIATGNPGCLMQIGAGLEEAGLDIRAIHPVILLDWSYREAGYYESER